MLRRAEELRRRERLEHHREPPVDAAEDGQRDRRIRVAAVRQLGPDLLLVGLDGWRVLGQRQLDARVRVEMAVGDVVHDLPRCPPAVAIRRIDRRPGSCRARATCRAAGCRARDPAATLGVESHQGSGTNGPTGYRLSMTASSGLPRRPRKRVPVIESMNPVPPVRNPRLAGHPNSLIQTPMHARSHADEPPPCEPS